jgi:ribosomal protein L37AE/L43A
MTKIPILNGSRIDELRCTMCLLPMQYQTKKDGKFLWQCFKCSKKYVVSANTETIEEGWSPPR